MSAYNLPDYASKYFEVKELEKVYGQPNIESIAKLYKEVKINAQTVPTTLGGGQLGYLALVVPPAIYNTIPTSAPFVRPVDPGVFTPTPMTGVATRAGGGPPPLSAADITTLKYAWDERKRQYNEAQAVESTLRKQIVKAIDNDYLRPIRNTTTYMITHSIPDIFQFLQNTYGKITTGELEQKEMTVKDLVYDPETNVDNVFNKIDDLQDICVLTKNTKTDTQLMNMAYLIFQKTGIFMDSLRRWNQKPPVDKNYPNLKVFMRKEHLDLQDVGGLTVKALNQTNLVQELKDHQKTLANDMEEKLTANLMQTLHAFSMMQDNEVENQCPNVSPPPPSTENQHSLPYFQHEPNHHMLAAMQTADPSLQLLLQQMAQMQNKIDNLTLSTQNTNDKKSRVPSGNNSVNPKTGKPWRRYCWTHGCCEHWGRNCASKKRGHKDDATFRNRMGGSSENCL